MYLSQEDWDEMTTGHNLEDGEVTVEMWGKLMADQLQVYLLKRINLAMVNKSPDTIYVLPVLKWIMISLGQAQIRMDNIACQSLASSPPGVMPQNMKFNPFPLAAERTSPIPKPGPLIAAHVSNASDPADARAPSSNGGQKSGTEMHSDFESLRQELRELKSAVAKLQEEERSRAQQEMKQTQMLNTKLDLILVHSDMRLAAALQSGSTGTCLDSNEHGNGGGVEQEKEIWQGVGTTEKTNDEKTDAKRSPRSVQMTSTPPQSHAKGLRLSLSSRSTAGA